jgi:hypothetical protein
LVGDKLAITNRHVLQAVAVQGTGGDWNLYQHTTIDFLGEIDNPARQSPNIVFARPEPILGVDPHRLDVALLAIEPFTDGATPRMAKKSKTIAAIRNGLRKSSQEPAAGAPSTRRRDFGDRFPDTAAALLRSTGRRKVGPQNPPPLLEHS